MNPITLTGGEHAVLLIHGLQSSPVELLPLAKRLQQAVYTVHAAHRRVRVHAWRYSALGHALKIPFVATKNQARPGL